MEIDRAINKMILSIKLEDTIPEEYHSHLKRYFQEMYVVGFEAGRDDKAQDINHHSRKIMVQSDLNGKVVNTFHSLKEACKKTGFSKNGIMHSMKHNVPTRQKWLWKYLNEKPLPKI